MELPRSFELSEAAVRVATREPAKVEFAPSIVWTTRLATSAAAALVVIQLVGDVTGIVKQTETPVSVAILERAVTQAEVPVETVVEREVVVEKEVVKEVVELESAPVVEAAAESAVAVEEVVGAVTVEADTTKAVEMEAGRAHARGVAHAGGGRGGSAEGRARSARGAGGPGGGRGTDQRT